MEGKKIKEIPDNLAGLEKQIAGLSETVGELVSALVTAASQEVEEKVEQDSSLKSHSCEMAEQIHVLAHKVGEINHRAKSLHNRLQI